LADDANAGFTIMTLMKICYSLQEKLLKEFSKISYSLKAIQANLKSDKTFKYQG
jgi:hypothetical protein